MIMPRYRLYRRDFQARVVHDRNPKVGIKGCGVLISVGNLGQPDPLAQKTPLAIGRPADGEG
jgi:hypothetical protein